jgi:hypothetical protein
MFMKVSVKIMGVYRRGKVTDRYWGKIVKDGKETGQWCTVKFANEGQDPNTYVGRTGEFDDSCARKADGSIGFYVGKLPPVFTYEKQGPTGEGGRTSPTTQIPVWQ